MRRPSYDPNAAKQTVSLTINSELYAQARGFGINASKVAEAALAEAVAGKEAERLKAEIRQDLEATNAYAAEHGSFAEMVREHYQRRSGDDE